MRDISRAVQVNIDDNVPIVQIHFFEGLVPQNASVIDQDVNGSEFCDSVIDDAFGACSVGN